MAINLKSVFWVTKHGIPHCGARRRLHHQQGSGLALAGFTRPRMLHARRARSSRDQVAAIQFAGTRSLHVIHPGHCRHAA